VESETLLEQVGAVELLLLSPNAERSTSIDNFLFFGVCDPPRGCEDGSGHKASLCLLQSARAMRLLLSTQAPVAVLKMVFVSQCLLVSRGLVRAPLLPPLSTDAGCSPSG
jgi:hypothetical protein